MTGGVTWVICARIHGPGDIHTWSLLCAPNSVTPGWKMGVTPALRRFETRLCRCRGRCHSPLVLRGGMLRAAAVSPVKDVPWSLVTAQVPERFSQLL